MAMKLHYGTGSCSLLVHMVLEELGVPFESVKVDLAKGEQHGAAYRAVNAKGKVPALVTPDGTLTECVAIVEWLLDRHGDNALLAKPGTWARAKTMEQVATLATEVHPLFNRFFHEGDFSKDPAVQAAVKSHGARKISAWFAAQDAALEGDWWSGAKSPTLSDLYFAVIARWGRWLDPPATRLPNIESFLNRLATRPAVSRALAREGITLFS
jgi:glutathione S-transferase